MLMPCLPSLRLDLERFVSQASSTWETRFTTSVRSYRAAELQVIANHINDVIPDLETHMSLRKDLSGLYMLFDLFEVAENLSLSPLDEDKFSNLKRCAAEIITCSLVRPRSFRLPLVFCFSN